jgi:2-keto-3-deoxy-L-rhamnonate aldolase RhmA
MAHASLTARWEAGQPALGGWVTGDSESTIAIYGRLGYDYVGIDTQHSPVSEAQAALLVRRLGQAPHAVIVRVSKNDAALIGRLLDAGSDGVIVPMVSTAEDAAAAVAACRYPPAGVRSFGPFRADLGLDLAELEQRVSCFVMIETAEGLANVRQICAVPGLAGVYIGPADLSIGLGLDPLLAFSTDQLEEPVAAIKAACAEFDLIMGSHSLNATDATRWVGRGAQLVSLGADSVMLGTMAAQELAVARGGTSGQAGPTGADEPISPYGGN